MGGRWRPPAITVWALRGRHKITRQVPPSRKRGLSADVGDLSICLAAIFLSVSLGQAEALLGVAKTPRTQAAPNPPQDGESKGLPYTGVLPGRMTTTS